MFLQHTESDEENFTINLIQELLNNMYQYFTDNHDPARFGPQLDPLDSIPEKDLLLNVLRFFKDVFRDDYRRAEMLKGKITGFSNFYNLLADQNSKDLLAKIITYRLLGKQRVKLPLNTPAYWEKREYAKSLIMSDETISFKSSFMNWDLVLLNLEEINYPIQLFATSAGIPTVYIDKQYEYNFGTRIKAEQGDVVLDAGGCWGDTALYFAHEVGHNGIVYSFEFIPENLEIIEKNINLNPRLKERIEVIKRPVWSKSGEILHFAVNGPGSSVISETTGNNYISFASISIDDFLKDNNIGKVDFIKMDIESSEMNALEGAIETLNKYRPKLAISLYHKPDDIITIPHFISSLNLDYEFYLGHHTIHNEETVLFARSQGR